MDVLRTKQAGMRLESQLASRPQGQARAFPVFVDPASRCRMIPNGDVIVRLAARTSPADIAPLLAGEEQLLVRKAGSAGMNTFLLRSAQLRTCDPMASARRLMADARVLWAQPDFAREVRRHFTPNDQYFTRQQILDNTGQNGGTPDADVDAPEAWDITRGTNSIVIAVVDDGFFGHPDVVQWVNAGEFGGGKESNLIDDDGNGYVDDYRGWDYVDEDNNPMPTGTDNHGMGCAGVAMATGNNTNGLAGASHFSRILPLCVFHGEDLATDLGFGEAIAYAADYADVINCSWGGGAPTAFISDAIDYAVVYGRAGKGCPVFVAAGNEASHWGRSTLSLEYLIPGTYRFGFTFECITAGDQGSIDDVGIMNRESGPWVDNYWRRQDLMTNQTFEGATFPPTNWLHTNIWGTAQWTRSGADAKTGTAGSFSARTPSMAAGVVSSTLLTAPIALNDLLSLVLDDSLFSGTDGTLFIDLFDEYGEYIEPFEFFDTYWDYLYPDVGFPASHSNAIAVGASTDCDRRSDYSCYGANLALVAPSDGGFNGVASLDVPGAGGESAGDYIFAFGGTSSATPLVAGITALVLARNPTLSLADLRTLLFKSCDKIGGVAYTGGISGAGGTNSFYGYGRINAYKALTNTPIPGLNYAPTNIVISSTNTVENLSVGTTLAAFTTQDPDSIDTFTYALVNGTGDTDNAAFTVSGSNLLSASSLNYEYKSNYSIRVRSLDSGGLSVQKVFTLRAADVNESPTNLVISGTNVAENLSAGTVIGGFATQDPDAANTFTYALAAGTGGTDNASFTVSGTNLLTAAAFNYETKSNYSIRIQSADNGGLTTQFVFAIQVASVNEKPTNIVLSTATVAENSTNFSAVGSFTTQDTDFTNAFTYALVSGNGATNNASFSISGSNLLAAVTFDYETKSNYTIRVQSTDQGGLTTQIVFIVSVSNVAEPPTNIVLSRASVAENLSAGAVVGGFRTQDPDAGNTFTYTLAAGTGDVDNASFTLGGTNLLTAVSFDYEGKNAYSIRIETADQGGLLMQRVFTITVTNINERPTNIVLNGGGAYGYTIENGPIGSPVASFVTQDPDSGNSFVYTLVGGAGGEDNASFTLTGGGGNHGLITATAMNYELKSNLSVRVQSTDQGGLSTQKVFIVNVGNAQESPTNILLSSSNVAENLPAETLVASFSSQDPDFTNAFSYALVAGTGSTDNASFTISDSNLLTAAVFDYESKSNYSIRVRSTDHFGLSTQKVFVINVSNVISEPPTNLLLSSTNVAEHMDSGTTVGTLETQDQNAGDTFTYALAAGPGDADNASFAVSGSNVLTTVSFNYELRSTYSIRLQSTDQTSLSTQQVFTIQIGDLDEPAPALLALSDPTQGAVVIRWSSLTNHSYTIHYSTNPLTGYSVLHSNILATPDINSYTDALMTLPARFWKVSTDP